MGFTLSHPEAKGECSQPGHEVGDQSEISVSKRMEVIGLSPWTSEMDMTLAMNFRVDIGDPRRRGVVTGRQAPCGHKKSHKLMAQNHTPSPPPSIPFSKGQVWASCSFRRLQGEPSSCLFQFLEVPLSTLPTSKPVPPTSASTVTSDGPHPPIRTLVMTLGPLSSPRTISPFENLYLQYLQRPFYLVR